MKRILLFLSVLFSLSLFAADVRVTGLGQTNYFPVWRNGNSVTTNSQIYQLGTLIGVGTTNPSVQLEVSEGVTTEPRGVMTSQYSTGTNGARLSFRKARGTQAAPTTVVSGDLLGALNGWVYDSANYLNMAGIEFGTTGTIAATRVPTEMRFYTATDALPSVKTLRLTIDKDGLAVFTGNTLTMPGAGAFRWLARSRITSSSDGNISLLDNNSASFTKLSLGPETASFPAIKRNGAGIDIRTADDSAYATITAGSVISSAGTALIANGLVVETPTTVQTLSAGTAISGTKGTVKIVGNGGPIVSTATPTLADSVYDGTVIRIFGTASVNTVTLTDETGLPGSNLELNAATRVMGLGSILVLYYDATTTKWWEQSYSANP